MPGVVQIPENRIRLLTLQSVKLAVTIYYLKLESRVDRLTGCPSRWSFACGLEAASSSAVFEKTCATTQKNVKSHIFWISKKRKKRKNVRIIFDRCLMFIVPLHCCQNLTRPNVPPLDIQQWLRMDNTRRGSEN